MIYRFVRYSEEYVWQDIEAVSIDEAKSKLNDSSWQHEVKNASEYVKAYNSAVDDSRDICGDAKPCKTADGFVMVNNIK